MFEHDIKDASKKKNIFRNNFFLLFVNRLYHENEAASYFSFLNIHYRKFQLTWKKNEMNDALRQSNDSTFLLLSKFAN